MVSGAAVAWFWSEASADTWEWFGLYEIVPGFLVALILGVVVSQFTLYGDVRKGRRPSWTRSAKGDQAEPLYERFMAELEAAGVHVERGVFGAQMEVSLTNSGPFTLIVDSDELKGPRRG